MKKLRTFIFLITAVLFTNSCGNSKADDNEASSKTKPDSLAIVETVKICFQTWTLKNLDVCTYQNGDTITEVKNINTLKNIKTGAWCYYNFDPKNGKKYGKLYNWFAVNDPRGLAPKGFHIPSDIEYEWVSNQSMNEKGFEGLPGGCFSETPFNPENNTFDNTLGADDFLGIGGSGMWYFSSGKIFVISYYNSQSVCDGIRTLSNQDYKKIDEAKASASRDGKVYVPYEPDYRNSLFNFYCSVRCIKD